MKSLATVLITTAALACLLSMLVERSQAKGLCISQLRIVTERERINSAVAYTLQRFPPTLELYSPSAITFFRPHSFTSFANVKDFLAKNPNCCTVGERGSDGWRPPFLDRLFGYTSAIVHLKYSISYLDLSEAPAISAINAYVPISSCGRAWEGS